MRINLIRQHTYFPNLDGLRFLAFLAVFKSHALEFSRYNFGGNNTKEQLSGFFSVGDLGVSFFFVLSGFLITYLLLKEKTSTGNVSVKQFYVRRILRIWPLYFFVIALGFFVLPAVFGASDVSSFPFDVKAPLSQLAWYLLFAANFDLVAHGVRGLMVAVLWSVSVEEQFYLLWPWINKFGRKTILPAFIALVLLVSFVYRFMNYRNSYILEYASLSVFNDLCIGSFSAWLIIHSEKTNMFFGTLSKKYILLVYLLLFALVLLRHTVYSFNESAVAALLSLEPVIFSCLFAFVILEQNFSANSVFKLSHIPFLSYLGRISYGLYCYHMICLFVVAWAMNRFFKEAMSASAPLFVAEIALTLGATIALSALSYAFLEKPFLRLKEKYST